MGHQMMTSKFFVKRPSLSWQQNLEHNGLELGLCKRSLHQMGCFQDRFILIWAVRNYSKAHICTPAKKSYIKYTKNHYLATKKFLHFLIWL